jgi:aminocarboxymuconate-semialdehyde decarboxylase
LATQAKRIDVHNHVIPDELLDAIAANPARFRMRIDGEGAKRKMVRAETGHAFPIVPELHDAQAKIRGLDQRGIDLAFLSPGPMAFCYWMDSDAGIEASRLINNGIARMCEANPERLMGMGTVPMQHPDAAVAELERLVRDHGFRAMEIGTEVGAEQIADPKFRKLLRRAAELKVFIFAHPFSWTPFCAGLSTHHLNNLIGNPLGTTIMAGNLMLSGVMDELPDLKICLAHGGGFLPYQIGRFAHGHALRKDVSADTPVSPYDLLRRFYFDALTHDADSLRFLIDRVGADRVTLGTDAPFDMGEDHPVDALNQVKGLTAGEREQICCRTALSLMGESG